MERKFRSEQRLHNLHNKLLADSFDGDDDHIEPGGRALQSLPDSSEYLSQQSRSSLTHVRNKGAAQNISQNFNQNITDVIKEEEEEVANPANLSNMPPSPTRHS